MITTLHASMGGVDWPKMIAAEYFPIPGMAVRTFMASSSGIFASPRRETGWEARYCAAPTRRSARYPSFAFVRRSPGSRAATSSARGQSVTV